MKNYKKQKGKKINTRAIQKRLEVVESKKNDLEKSLNSNSTKIKN